MSKEIMWDRILARKRAVEAGAIVVLLLLFGAAFFKWERNRTPVSASVNVSHPQENNRITLAAAGDIIPHQTVVQSGAAQNQSTAETHTQSAPDLKENSASQTPAAGNHGGWDLLFANVADVFRQADFGFVNLETPVPPAHSPGSKPFQFDAPINLLAAFKFTRVKLLPFANNHSFNQS